MSLLKSLQINEAVAYNNKTLNQAISMIVQAELKKHLAEYTEFLKTDRQSINAFKQKLVAHTKAIVAPVNEMVNSLQSKTYNDEQFMRIYEMEVFPTIEKCLRKIFTEMVINPELETSLKKLLDHAMVTSKDEYLAEVKSSFTEFMNNLNEVGTDDIVKILASQIDNITNRLDVVWDV